MSDEYSLTCFECGAEVAAGDLSAFGDAFLGHARSSHEWPFPDQAVRNFAEATQRLTGGSERLPTIGEVAVHSVDDARLDDWLHFFDHDGFVGTPEWAGCYCLEPHLPPRDDVDARHWSDTRAAMADRLRAGESFGYLAYVVRLAVG
jgi:hypothetical protein